MTRMPWGKFKGIPIAEIESSYLVWCLENAENLRPVLRQAIKDEIASRFASAPPPPPAWRKPCPDSTLAANVVAAGVRTLARKHHPDAGGSTQMMQAINAVADWLKAQVPQ